jgi:predicted permease
MRIVAAALARLRLLFRRGVAESRMDEEFRFHVEMETAKNLRAGLSPREARRRALVSFGGVERHREAMRDGRGSRLLEDLVQDARFAFRSLVRRPGFTAVAVSTIALGVGSTTVVFTMVNAMLLRPLPVPQPDRLFGVAEARTGAVWQGSEGAGVPYERYLAYRDATGRVFTGLAAQRSTSFSLRAGGEAVAVRGVLASGNYFSVAGLRPVAGRFFTADDERAVVLAHHVWRDRFGGVPDVADAIIHLDSRPYRIAGVAPRGFTGLTPAVAADVWVPIAAARAAPGLESMASWVAMFGRLRPGVAAASADALVDVVAKAVPPGEPQTRVQGASLEPMTGMLRGHARVAARPALGLLLATAFLVLLTASLNTAGMLLARGVARRRELAVRVTLGAGRGRLVRQLLAESALLATLGGAGGVVLALLGARVVAATPVPFFSTLIGLDLRLDLRVLAFALALTAATALVFGFLPALHASRPALAPALKEGASGATARARGRSAFAAAQMGMALFLVLLAGLFVQSFQRTLATGLGFDYEGVVIATTSLDAHGYDEARGRAFQQALVERVRSIPGTESVTLARAPLLGGAPYGNDMIAASGDEEPRREWGVAQNRVEPEFFATVRLPLVAGRGFTAADGAGDAPVTVVNETLARRLWPDRSPLGQRVASHGGEYVVVGVARDGRYAFRGGFPSGYAFFPAAQQYAGTMTLHVRSSLDPAELIRRVRHEVRALDPNVAVEQAQPLSVPVERIHAPQRAATTLLVVFGGVGLLLAGLGVYGVLAFQVAQRSRELGVRVALGAPARSVIRLVVGRGAILALAGAAAGLGLGAAASVALQRVLYGVPPFDPVTFGVASLVLLSTFLLGCLAPVLRALRVDPIHVLRAE